MDPDLDCEIELEDFMCIDEEEDTNEPSTSGAELPHRRKDVESGRDKRYDRPFEAFNHSASWRTTSRPCRDRWTPRGSAYFHSFKRSRDPLLMHRHPDFDAFLKRRSGKLEKMRMEITNRKEVRPESRQDEPIGVKRGCKTDNASTERINEEVTLEEVDCCDSDEESICDITYEPNALETFTADKPQSDDRSVLGSEAFKHEGIGDLRTHDDPLWACEEDWPDLLGEVDEEAVRRAANQPIAVESNVALIVPQLASSSGRHDSNRSSRGDDRAPNDAKTRNDSERNEDRSGTRGEKAKQVTKSGRVSSWRARRRPGPCIYQHHQPRDDLGHLFESPKGREQRQIPSSTTQMDQKYESTIRKHRLHEDHRPLTHRSSHDNREAQTQGESGSSAKKMTSPKTPLDHAVNLPYSKVDIPLPHTFSISPSKGARSSAEALERWRAVSPSSSHLRKMPPYFVRSSDRSSRSAVFLESRTRTPRCDDFRCSFDVPVGKKHLMPAKSEDSLVSRREEHNGRCLPERGRHMTEAQVICPLAHSDECGSQIRDVGKERASDRRTKVKSKLNDIIRVSPAQKRSDDVAQHFKQSESSVSAAAKNSPLLSSTPPISSTAQEKLPSVVPTKDVEHKNAVRAVIFHKEADTRPLMQSHLSITVQGRGNEARNVSHAFRNVSCASLQGTNIGNSLTAPKADKSNIASTKKSPCEEEIRGISASVVECSQRVRQHPEILDEGAVEAKKRRWTITNATKATSYMTTSISSNDDKQKAVIGQISQKGNTSTVMAAMSTVTFPGGDTRRQIKLRLPSLSTA
uniref:Uncharacterized protein n=2 Tax=Parascaris univalens TaxID=6257 RepID=A0A915AWL5_PARUN